MATPLARPVRKRDQPYTGILAEMVAASDRRASMLPRARTRRRVIQACAGQDSDLDALLEAASECYASVSSSYEAVLAGSK